MTAQSERRQREKAARRLQTQGEPAGSMLPSPPRKPYGDRNWRRNLPRELLKPRDSLDTGMSLIGRFKRFKDIGEHPLYPLIHARLIAGQSPWRVAIWVQGLVQPGDILHPTVTTRNVLFQRLKRYRALLPPGVSLPESYLDELLKKADVEVDVLIEAAAALTFQKLRISKYVKGPDVEESLAEREQMRREVETYGHLLEIIRDTQNLLRGSAMQPFIGVQFVNSNGGQGADAQAATDDEGGIFTVDPITDMIEHNPMMIPTFLQSFRQGVDAAKALPPPSRNGDAPDAEGSSE